MIGARTVATTCVSCHDALEHCHGTWVVDDAGVAWCTDDDCGLDGDGHAATVEAAALNH